MPDGTATNSISRRDHALATRIGVDDADISLEQLERLASTLHAVVAYRQRIHSRLQRIVDTALVVPRGGAPPSSHARMMFDRAQQDIDENLYMRTGGAYDSELSALRHQPGLATLQQLLHKAQARLEERRAGQAAMSPMPYRFIGKRFQTKLGGQFLEPGDVIKLSDRQLTSLAGLFEPVLAPGTGTAGESGLSTTT